MVRLFVLYSKGESLTAIRLCTETPPAGGRVFEKGDELLVEFAAKIQGNVSTFRRFSFHSDRLVIVDQSPLLLCSLSMTDLSGRR